MSYSEFRSALYNDRYTEAFQIMNSLDHPDERKIASDLWWQLVKPDLVAPDLVWSGAKEGEASLWYLDEETWTLSLAGHIIATNETLDLDPIQAKWAIIPARHVIPIWENWAKDNAPKHLKCVRELLDLVDQNANPKMIKRAREAISGAAEAARDAARAADLAGRVDWAAEAADWAALTTNLTTWADCWVARATAYYAGWATAYWAVESAERDVANAENSTDEAKEEHKKELCDKHHSHWCLEWTKHVFTLIKESK